jgi:hypothetical protein
VALASAPLGEQLDLRAEFPLTQRALDEISDIADADL